MTSAAQLREMNRRVGTPGRLALIIVLVAMVACAVSLKSFAGAVLSPSARSIQKGRAEITEQLKGDYAKGLASHTAQFDGRSIFFIPSPPPPKPVPETPKPKPVELPPPLPTKPTTYGGPKLIAMINDEAWFDDGQKLVAGTSGKDITVKAVRAPWDVVLVWKEVEFNVSLFEADKVVYPPKNDPKAVKAPGLADAKPDSSTPAKPEASPETKPEAKPDSKPETTPESKPPSPAPESPKPEGATPKPAPTPETPTPAPKPAEGTQ